MKQRKQLFVVLVLFSVLGCLFGLLGCRPSDDDPEGQAKLLADPVRREHAVANLTKLYAQALSQAKGNRSAAAVQQLTATIAQPLTKTFVENPEDHQNRVYIMDLLADIRSPETLPALLDGLDWRQEIGEELAVRAARTIRNIKLNDSQRQSAATALGKALEKVSGDRPVDNRMRKEFITALGAVGGPAATKYLADTAVKEDPKQSFVFNRLALAELARLGDASNLDLFIESMFRHAAGRPDMRMNDIAVQGLVMIGKPAIEPVKKLLAAKHEKALNFAKGLINAAKKAGASVNNLHAEDAVAIEASYAAGELGAPVFADALVSESNHNNPERRWAGLLGLTRLQQKAGVGTKTVAALRSAYGPLPKQQKPQMIVAMQHAYSADLLPVFLEQARSNETEMPQLRLLALNAYAVFANKAEAAAAKAIIQSEPGPEEGGYKTNFKQDNDKALAAAVQCDKSESCWVEQLKNKDTELRKKATFMLARYGKGTAIEALRAALKDADLALRIEILYALDHLETNSDPALAQIVAELADAEEGKTNWVKVEALARTTVARLNMR